MQYRSSSVNVKPEVKDVGVQCQLINIKPHPLTSTPLKSLPEFGHSHSLSTDHDSSDSFKRIAIYRKF